MAAKDTENAKKAKESEVLSVLNEDLVESADRVGNLLCNERLKKGLDLDEISQVLCIRRIYLEAIENGNYVELPPLPYSAGFVNSYAKYLGLNNARITQLFREELDEKPKDKNVFMIEDAGPEASLPDKRYIFGGIAAIVVIALGWSLINGLSSAKENENANVSESVAEENVTDVEYFSPSAAEFEEKSEAANEKNNSDVAVSVENAEDASEQVIMKEESFVEPVKPVKPSTKIEIKIVKDDTWIEVRDANSNKVYFNKVMKPGETYVVPEGSGKLLSAGKFDTVEVYADGVLIPVLEPTKTKKVSLDPFMETAEH